MSTENVIETDTDETANSSFSFVEAEHKVLKFWDQEKIFQQTLNQSKNKPPYIFYDGPPFATGLPHHGHLVGSTLKDIIPRYFTMCGHYVERRFGWDCHGLPIEHEIDKKLGMSAHEALEKLGVAKYNQECRAIVGRFTAEWKKTIDRLGRWVDFENDYKTMDTNFMESVWWVLSELWKKGLIYRGNKVVPFSTALGSVLANFEANQNYQEVQDPSITVLFPLIDEEASLAVWTTTPWTLPSNLAVCVGGRIDYVLVEDEVKNIKFYIAKSRIPAYNKKKNLKVLKELKGSELKGRRYNPLFSFFKHFEKEGGFVVLNDDYVGVDEGTGIVHTAPAFGEDDNRIMKDAGLAEVFVMPMDDAGKFTGEVPDYKGMYFKDADKKIMQDLKAKNLMYEQSVLVHNYPFCYRSDTPLMYRAIPTWYVNVEKVKSKMLSANEQIHWVPEHLQQGRFGNWLSNARDWAISRNRVWGTPIPLWINDQTEEVHCIGSVGELEKLTGTKLTDIHREFVDQLTFTLPGKPGTYRRIPEVLDCWFESGSMPYAQLHYPFENKDVFELGFPAAFIAEGIDQTRGWFYTLTVIAAALFDRPAFKNVIVNGLVMAEDGKKMSKRLRNYTPPDELMETYGADAFRIYLMNSGLVKAEELRFSDIGVKDMVRRILLPWYNAFKFFQTYASVDLWNPVEHSLPPTHILDQWILSKLQTLKKRVQVEMEDYKLYNVVPHLFDFIEDLTNWYIRLNRRRFWGEDLTPDKRAAYSTLYTALHEITLIMAPFTPFLSETIFLELKKFGGLKEASVHLGAYPIANSKLILKTLESAVLRMQQVILLGRQKRNQKQLKVKLPLQELKIIHRDSELLKEMSKLEEIIKIELNVKEVIYETDETKYVTLSAKPNLPILGKRFGARLNQFKEAISKLNYSDLTELWEEGQITVLGEVLGQTDLIPQREGKLDDVASSHLISIYLSSKLTPALIQEGLAREVVNRIQKTRKEAGFNVDDRIHLEYEADQEVAEAIENFQTYIQQETLCEDKPLSVDFSKEQKTWEYDIDGKFLKITLTKHSP